MDMILRGIDIRDHGVDRYVGILEQVRAIAAHRLEAVDGTPEPEEVGVELRNVRLQISRIHSRSPGDIGHGGEHRMHATDPPASDAGFAEEEVSQDAHHRQNDDHHDPRHPRSRLPMRPQNDPGDRDEVDEDVDSSSEHGVALNLNNTMPRSLAGIACRLAR